MFLDDCFKVAMRSGEAGYQDLGLVRTTVRRRSVDRKVGIVRFVLFRIRAAIFTAKAEGVF